MRPWHARAVTPTEVAVEAGARRVFASALSWPGWCRAARDEAGAVAALAAYAPRYAVVARRAGIRFPTLAELSVVERLGGSATTDFGAPATAAVAEQAPLSKAQAERLAALVDAAWLVFDDVVTAAPPALRKGPRGGGRDRDKIAEHVLGAEREYARKLGIRVPAPTLGEPATVLAMRELISAALANSRRGPSDGERGWPPRYAARRIAWHVLDHAWEIEDRSER